MIGEYKLENRIGKGAFSEVYITKNIQNNQISAKIKEMQQSDNRLTRNIARYLANQQKQSSPVFPQGKTSQPSG